MSLGLQPLKAQNKDSVHLSQAVVLLNKALIVNDKKVLKSLLHPRLSYAHSNGWVEHKKELLSNLNNEVIQYKNIELKSLTIQVENNIGMVQAKGIYTVRWKGTITPYKLKTIQIWNKKRNKWQLVSRQSEAYTD